MLLILPKLCLQGKSYFPAAPTLKLKHLYTREQKERRESTWLARSHDREGGEHNDHWHLHETQYPRLYLNKLRLEREKTKKFYLQAKILLPFCPFSFARIVLLLFQSFRHLFCFPTQSVHFHLVFQPTFLTLRSFTPGGFFITGRPTRKGSFVILAGFLKRLPPNGPFPSNAAISKTKRATIAFFSSPSFLLLALSFSPFLFLRYCDFGASRA